MSRSNTNSWFIGIVNYVMMHSLTRRKRARVNEWPNRNLEELTGIILSAVHWGREGKAVLRDAGTCSRSHSWFAPELAQHLTISGAWSSEFSISPCSLLACWFGVRNVMSKGNPMTIEFLWTSWAIDLFRNRVAGPAETGVWRGALHFLLVPLGSLPQLVI